MAEEEEIEDTSIEGEVVEEEPEAEETISEEEEKNAPLDYTKKLGEEEASDDEKESGFTQFVNKCIEYLNGKSRKVVLWTLAIF